MRTVVELGSWEHECCGPAYERDVVVDLRCLIVPARDGSPRFVESHHDLSTWRSATWVRGRVVDIAIQHPDGSTEPIGRLPSGAALRGVHDHDDGHLEQPWTGVSVSNDSDRYLVTVAS